MKSKIFLLLILVLAAFFRFYRLGDYAEFLGDQGRDVVIIRDFLKNGNLFFIGPQTSIGNMYLGPYFYYLISPSLFLANFNPLGPAIFIGLLSLLTTFLLYRFGTLWFSSSVGLIAALIFAVSPTIIKYSNFIWNPNIMPLFSLLFVYFLTQAFQTAKLKNLIWATLAFIFCLNSHYLALLLLPSALILWLIFYFKNPSHRCRLFQISLICLSIFILSLVPQILFDLKHDGLNLKAMVHFFTERQTTVNLKPYKSLPLLPSLFNQINTSLLAAKYSQIGVLVSVVFVLGLIYLLVKKRPLNYYFLALCLWYLVGLLGLGLYKQHIYDHYFGFLFPAVVLLFAFIIDNLIPKTFLKIVLTALILLILLSRNPFLSPPPKQLSTVTTITSDILQKSNHQPFNFALLAKNNYDPPYRYFFYQANAPLYLVTDQLTDQLFVVCEPDGIDCNPINNPATEIANFGWSKIKEKWSVGSYQVFYLIHAP